MRIAPALLLLSQLGTAEAGPVIQSPSYKSALILVEGQVSAELRRALNKVQGPCPNLSFSKKSFPRDRITTLPSTPTHGFEIGTATAEPSCEVVTHSTERVNVCSFILASTLEGHIFSSQVVGAACTESPAEKLDLSSMAPESIDGFSVINPQNVDYYLEQMKGKSWVLMTTTSGCAPCHQVRDGIRGQAGSDRVLLIDMDDPQYTQNGSPTAEAKAFFQSLGWSEVPYLAPMVLALTPKPGGGWTPKTLTGRDGAPVETSIARIKQQLTSH